MNIKLSPKVLLNHPLGALYGTLLGIIAFSAALPMFSAGMADAALVDLAMAAILIALMLKNHFLTCRRETSLKEKCAAWLILLLADILALLPTHNFAGDLITALAFSLFICALVLYFSGALMAAISAVPAVWCCVFMPYHEEIMLLLSFPLRLNATVLSAWILNLSGINIIHSGTSLILPGLNIAITDACSGIRQLDAFILLAFITVQMLHTQTGWKLLHFAFIIPSIILGNSLRIVLTVWLYRIWGETVFENTWHTALGYGQIIFALAIFLAVGKLFSCADKKTEEEKQ
jgi:exosortase